MTAQDTINDIRSIYEEAELALFRILAKKLESGPVDNNAWVKQKLASIKSVREELVRVINSLAATDDTMREAILQAFLDGLVDKNEGLIQTNQQAIQSFIEAYTNNARIQRLQILRAADDIYRKVIQSVGQRGIIGINTRTQVAKQALSRFAANGVTSFYSKDGKRYDMTTYTEMATRTSINNAYREGKIASVSNSEDDLVIVRSGPRHCETCDPWANKILSISGQSKKYQSLDYAKSKGLFHPNCRCSLSKYIPGVTKVDTKEKIENNYDSEQEQRQLERDIRKYKRILAVDPNNTRAADMLKKKQTEVRNLVKEENLPRKPNRESIKAAR